MKKLADYMALPYTVVLRKDEDGDFVARVDELRGCVAHGPTSAEALQILRDVQKEWISDALERGAVVPEPSNDDDLPSGKWLQRVPRTLHAKLARRAKDEGVSLNLLVSTILAEACGTRSRRAGATPEPPAETGKTVFNLSARYFAQTEGSTQYVDSAATESRSSRVN